MAVTAAPDAPRLPRSSVASALPAYPVLLVAAYILGQFGITHAHPAVLIRPLLLGIGLTAVLVGLLALVLEDRHRAALLMGAIVISFAGYWPVVLVVGWWMAAKRFRPRLPLPSLPSRGSTTRMLNGFAVAWVGLALVLATPQLLRGPTQFNAPFDLSPVSDTDRPDIFVVLLDGYARGDTLEAMGYDNEPFLRELEERGFEVYREATGSYEYTVQVMASMLHGRHLVDIPVGETPDSDEDQHRLMLSMIGNAPVLDEFRGIGYEVVVSRSHASHATVWTADRLLASGTLTDFELRLLHDTELDRAVTAVAPTFMWDAYRERVTSQFDHLRELGEEHADSPRVNLVHLISPHPPFTFNADGSAAPPLECFPVDCEGGWIPDEEMTDADFNARYVAQVQAINDLTLDALEPVLDDPDAIVVVMSDHGARMDSADRSEWYRTLFAARTPGHPGAFDSAPHPTALFATIAREYFGSDVELPSMTRYAMVDDNRLRLVPIQ